MAAVVVGRKTTLRMTIRIFAPLFSSLQANSSNACARDDSPEGISWPLGDARQAGKTPRSVGILTTSNRGRDLLLFYSEIVNRIQLPNLFCVMVGWLWATWNPAPRRISIGRRRIGGPNHGNNGIERHEGRETNG